MAVGRSRIAFHSFLAVILVLICVSPVLAQTRYLDLSKAANVGPADAFDGESTDVEDPEGKNGFSKIPPGSQTLRGVPFRVLDPSRNGGRSFVALKGRKKSDFPEAVSIPADGFKASSLYFLHTCRWGGTGTDVTVAEYDVVYEDGAVEVIPLRVGVEFSNFFGADDTSASFLAWWRKYKNIEMGVSLYPWKNPHPEKPIESILFKSRSKMPVPILFAITASDKEIPLSQESPKPEKVFKTDTTGWIPFAPSDISPKGTAIDMSFLLDAPAGKHGRVKADGDKLVFEDGTPARFCGTRFPSNWCSYNTGEMRGILDRMASYGWNLIRVTPPLPRSNHPCDAALEALTGLARERGIYLVWDEVPAVASTTDEEEKRTDAIKRSLFLSEDDPILVPARTFLYGSNEILNLTSGDRPSRVETSRGPMVLDPVLSPFFTLVGKRELARPFIAHWLGRFSTLEHLAELPLLFSSQASLQGWSGFLFWEAEMGGLTALWPASQLDPWSEPRFFIHWPSASLAYLREDLKEGKAYVLEPSAAPTFMESEIENRLKALAHKSGITGGNNAIKTDPSGVLKAKVQPKLKSFVSDTGQITWQGNVGVVKVEAPRFQALIGFLGNRKFNNPYWAVETPNNFASLSLISLTKGNITMSDHLLLTGVTRMENTGQTYNAAKTKLLSLGTAPILVEPLSAKFVLYRLKADPKLKIRALDANGQSLPTKVPTKWMKNNLVFSWVPSAFYLELYK